MAALDNIRRNIKALLPEREQSAFAKRIGMSGPLLSNYLTGEKDPGVGQLERIAAGLGVSFASLVKDEMPQPMVATPIERDKLKAMQGILSADDPDIISNVLAALEIGFGSASAARKNRKSSSGA